MKILIIKLSSIGDLFHALPAVHNLKVKLNAEVDWVTNDSNVDLVKCFSDVDRVIPFHRHSFFSNFKTFLTDLRKEKYDYVIDLQGLLKSAVVARLARADKRVGPSFHREGSRLFYSSVAGSVNKNRHAVEENLDIIDHLGLEKINIEFPVEFPRKKVSDENHKFKVAVLPMSRWVTKNWPVSCYMDLCRDLQHVEDIQFFVLGSPADVDACGMVESALDDAVVNMGGVSTLVEMGSVLQEMDLLISNDSGPVHMSAAIGTPALVVFGPTDQNRTGPYGNSHRVLTAAVPCRPCFSRSCQKEGIPCLDGVTTDDVAVAALEMLKKQTV